jgi:Putative auto-transporter adhesin, head GIN domain
VAVQQTITGVINSGTALPRSLPDLFFFRQRGCIFAYQIHSPLNLLCSMKKRIVIMTAAFLLSAAGIQAQDKENMPYALSELAISSFRKIVVNAHIDVVLVQNDTLKKAYIEGEEALVPEISVTVSQGVMTIASGREISYRGKVQITVPVKELSALDINADAGIVSFAPLQTAKLMVNVNGYCDLHLKSTGKVYLSASEEYSIKNLKTSGEESSVTVAGGSRGE